MKLSDGLTKKVRKGIKANEEKPNGKKSSWIEYNQEVGLLKEVGYKTISANSGLVGKVNKKVAKERGTF